MTSAALQTYSASRDKRSPASDLIAACEVLGTWSLIEATIWTSGKTQLRWFWISVIFILLTTAMHRPRWSDLGLSLKGLGSSLWVIPAAIVLSGSAVFIAWLAGTLHPLFGLIGVARHSCAYGVWAVFQQFILQSYFFLRLERLFGARPAVMTSSALFCLVHIPNPVLVTACLFAGWLACEVFRRNRNIYALGVAHAILGLTIAVTVPDDIQRHMRVGIGYYHYHAQRVKTPAPHPAAITTVSTATDHTDRSDHKD
jgi:membrane protease YdiL (CAAX protease family)